MLCFVFVSWVLSLGCAASGQGYRMPGRWLELCSFTANGGQVRLGTQNPVNKRTFFLLFILVLFLLLFSLLLPLLGLLA